MLYHYKEGFSNKKRTEWNNWKIKKRKNKVIKMELNTEKPERLKPTKSLFLGQVKAERKKERKKNMY